MAPLESRFPPASSQPADPDETRQVDPGSSQVVANRVSPSDDAEKLAPGSLAGAYAIERVLGSGGCGVIYSARHKLLGREAAVKVLRSDLANSPTMVARFLREATTVNTIRHPNIVDIYEFGELPDGRPFFVMELLAGTDLKKVLRVRGRYSPEESATLLGQVCSALSAAHRAGIVHRDLKASNVILCETENGPLLKLVDFGIAKLLHPEPGTQGLTEAGTMLGTSHNMAPEQIRGDAVDERTDIYALGILLYNLLTGKMPFNAPRHQDVAWMHLMHPAPKPSLVVPVPPAVDEVVLRCMEKEAARRYQSVAAFLRDLRQACGLPTGDLDEVAPAVGIYVELKLAEGCEDDDAILEDMAYVLDTVEGELGAAGFALPIQTANAILGVRVTEGRSLDADRQDAIELSKRLLEALADRSPKDPRLHVNVSVRAHKAAVRKAEGSVKVVGGPLLAIEQWVAQETTHELFVNDSFEATKASRA